MAKLQIKKSNEAGKIPQPADLDWGELAINYTDGKLFYKKHGTGTVEQLTTPAPGSGALTLSAGVGSTNTGVTIGTGTGFTANSSNPSTYTINIGPSITSLATLMSGNTTGFIKKTGEDTYTLDTNTYSTTDTNTTYSLDGQGSANDVDIQLIAGGSGSGIDSIKLVGSGATTVAWDENAQKITITSSDTDTVTRLRGTASGSFTTGDITLVAGSNVTVSQSGNDITIAATANDASKLPLAGGTVTGLVTFTHNAGSPGWNNIVIDASTAQNGAYIRANRASDTTGEVGYAWGTGGANQWINYLPTNSNTLQWYQGSSVVMSLTTNGTLNATNITVNNNQVLHANNYSSYALPLSGGTLTGQLTGVSGTTLSFNAGSSTADSYNYVLGAANDAGNKLVIFVNGSARTADGGVNAVTIRNDGGALNLGSNTYVTNILGSSTNISGTLQHGGLTMTAGTAVDQIYTHQQNITLTTGWQDTGVNAAELATGSYIVQVTSVDDWSVAGGHYSEYYTGIMSWYNDNTNSITTDEIPLHRAGHAPENGTIFLRIARTYSADSDNLKLQIAGSTNNNAPYQYTFKFRRLI